MLKRIGVIGLGYVGLPLACAFAKKHSVVGFDINEDRINQLKQGFDETGEVDSNSLKSAGNIEFTSSEKSLSALDYIVVTVPTPIDGSRNPDLYPLIKASQLVGRIIEQGATVIYESTVYPGATEEVCIPEIERFSGKTFNIDFFVGYSPERVNPGDKNRPITKIKKVTSGSTELVAEDVDSLYASVIEAGTFKASSIKVAEASKVIENTQRDVNIALINELAMIFNALNIDVHEVLDAAATKWNFIDLRPGLVGGHCIGVDPYYLLAKSLSVGYVPDLIRTSREINEGMASHYANDFVKKLLMTKIQVLDSKILVLGYTFKENCPDIRNTKIDDLVSELERYGMAVTIYDPWVSQCDAEKVSDRKIVRELTALDGQVFDAFLVGVAHQLYSEFDFVSFSKIKSLPFVYELKKIPLGD